MLKRQAKQTYAKNIRRKRTGLIFGLLFFFSTISAQTPISETLRLNAGRVSEEIKIDGVLNETAWTKTEAITDFRQQEPEEGEPASEKTEVKVLFDDKYLYFGIRAFDSEPTKINARELVRDASFSNDDKVEILLDTYHDRRNAFRL